jgi:hypothetical protein
MISPLNSIFNYDRFTVFGKKALKPNPISTLCKAPRTNIFSKSQKDYLFSYVDILCRNRHRPALFSFCAITAVIEIILATWQLSAATTGKFSQNLKLYISVVISRVLDHWPDFPFPSPFRCSRDDISGCCIIVREILIRAFGSPEHREFVFLKTVLFWVPLNYD